MIQCHPTEIKITNQEFDQNHQKKWLQTITKLDKTITHFTIRTHVEDASLVRTLLHPRLPHNLLLTLATHNEREVQPQSLRDPMHG
jgi:hypothetical protein